MHNSRDERSFASLHADECFVILDHLRGNLNQVLNFG